MKKLFNGHLRSVPTVLKRINGEIDYVTNVGLSIVGYSK